MHTHKHTRMTRKHLPHTCTLAHCRCLCAMRKFQFDTSTQPSAALIGIQHERNSIATNNNNNNKTLWRCSSVVCELFCIHWYVFAYMCVCVCWNISAAIQRCYPLRALMMPYEFRWPCAHSHDINIMFTHSHTHRSTDTKHMYISILLYNLPSIIRHTTIASKTQPIHNECWLLVYYL